MEGLRPFPVLQMFLCSAQSMHFVSNLEKCREYAFLRKYVQIITILHGGGPPNLLQHYRGEGSTGAPYLYCVIKASGKLLPRLIKPHQSPLPELDLS